MFFAIKKKPYLTPEQQRTDILLEAYFIIKGYPLRVSETLLDNYLNQYHKIGLKDLCVKLLLSLTFHIDEKENLIGIFKNQEDDKMAQLITYGNGATPGSRILQTALKR
jgi:hypothetical protein